MSQQRRLGLHPIAVALRLGDAGLRERLLVELAGTPDLVWRAGNADILITDSRAADDTGPVVLIGDVDPADMSEAVRAVLPVNASLATIVAATRLVAEGMLVLPESLFERLNEVFAEAEDEDDRARPSSAELTPREQEVLELLAAGASNKAIARQLDLSVHTVKFHVASLLRKLGASGRLEAVGIGLRTGLLMV